jgi:hypothetical protein
MAQETFEEFSRRVSYSVVEFTEPDGSKTQGLMCHVKLSGYGYLNSLNICKYLYIMDALSDEQKAFFLVLKARQGLNRLWEALQNRELRDAE